MELDPVDCCRDDDENPAFPFLLSISLARLLARSHPSRTHEDLKLAQN